MKAELLLWALVLWTLIGLVGTLVRRARGDRRGAMRSGLALLGVWAVYLVVLVTVSRMQAQRELAVDVPQCFGEVCFAVQGADEVEGFEARGQVRQRLLRVRVRVRNHGTGRPQSEGLLRANLVDGQGRRWEEVRGLSGVRLTAQVAAGDDVVSAPVFRVARDATGLRLVLTHGRWQPGVLVIGDPDSWMHRPTVMRLER